MLHCNRYFIVLATLSTWRFAQSLGDQTKEASQVPRRAIICHGWSIILVQFSSARGPTNIPSVSIKCANHHWYNNHWIDNDFLLVQHHPPLILLLLLQLVMQMCSRLSFLLLPSPSFFPFMQVGNSSNKAWHAFQSYYDLIKNNGVLRFMWTVSFRIYIIFLWWWLLYP